MPVAALPIATDVPPSGLSLAMPLHTAAVVPAAVALGPLSSDLSPWNMFLSADLVVKGVICALALASILTWTILLAKSLELNVGKRRLREAFRSLRQAQSLSLATESAGPGNGVINGLLRVASEEWLRSADALEDRDGLKERIALHLERVEAAVSRRAMSGTGILATIGSVAPFVGLFGTVWGIMHSFVGITRMHVTNLAAVAPGVAEALLATAVGLSAAIPAVVIYNHFVRAVGAYKAQIADASAAVMRLASRDLSHCLGSDRLRVAAVGSIKE